jgi:hypothetical protein
MMGYCSAAGQTRKSVDGIQAIDVPEPFAVGPEYSLAIRGFDNPATVGLALAILSPEGHAAAFRFRVPTLTASLFVRLLHGVGEPFGNAEQHRAANEHAIQSRLPVKLPVGLMLDIHVGLE